MINLNHEFIEGFYHLLRIEEFYIEGIEFVLITYLTKQEVNSFSVDENERDANLFRPMGMGGDGWDETRPQGSKRGAR